MVFKGKQAPDKGMYVIISQEKAPYFNFFINENTKFSIVSDIKNNTIKCTGSPENQEAFNYLVFMTKKNKDFEAIRQQTKGMSKEDSAKFVTTKAKEFEKEVQAFDSTFLKQHEGTYIADFLLIQKPKFPKTVPKASNGRPDSVYQYNYYKQHYWDGVNFKDDRVLRTPVFGDKVKTYFDKVILNVPDTIIAEIDRMMDKTVPYSDMHTHLLAYFTPKYEEKSQKYVGFDKVMVHMIDKYVRSGQAKKVYEEKTVEAIVKRGDILKPLLDGAQAPDLFMIDTINAKQVNKMGFDTAKTSQSLTDLYLKNVANLSPLYTTLHSVKAKYTVLVFWDVDCGHCQTEIPKLLETYHELRKKYDVKIFSVYTQSEFDKWRKYVIDKKLDFINIYDPIHLNNLKEKYDINSTPKIYLLDKDKRILTKGISQEKLPDFIEFMEKKK
jgi:thiol-disulfide isomerase/thioredoxin